MNLVVLALQLLSAVAFAGYGAAILLTDHMVVEFERYGLSRWRTLVGLLELTGALGLAAGYWFRPVGAAAALGLSLLMLLGILSRWRVEDSLLSTIPALVLLLLNLWVAGHHLGWTSSPSSA